MNENRIAFVSSEWLTPEETMKRLRIAKRTLQEWAQDNFLRWKLQQVEGRRPMRVYHAGDVERLLASGGPPRRRMQPDAFSRAPLALAAASNESEKRVATNPAALWLSVEDAAAYSGFSESFIMGLIGDQLVTARKGGPHGAWRIRRASLEAFAG